MFTFSELDSCVGDYVLGIVFVTAWFCIVSALNYDVFLTYMNLAYLLYKNTNIVQERHGSRENTKNWKE